MAFFVKLKIPSEVGFEYKRVFDTRVPSHIKENCIKPTPIRLSIMDALLSLPDLIEKFEAGELKEVK